MSGVSFPVTRPTGRALVVGTESNRPQAVAVLQQLGLTCAEVDDPYAAALELARRPLVYRAIILSLASVYKEELQLIATVKRRMAHVEVWLTHTDGRQAALAEAMRLGADGLLSEEGLHRTSTGAPATEPAPPPLAVSQTESVTTEPSDENPTEPILSAEELKALLQEQPTIPDHEA